MREIKVKVWDIKRKKWVTDFTIAPNGTIMCFGTDLKYEGVHETTLELVQYTGLKDKNGKEIYEGDLLCVVFSNQTFPQREIGIVEWNEDGMWMANSLPESGIDNNSLKDKLRVCQYVGNIYENPELLKQEEL